MLCSVCVSHDERTGRDQALSDVDVGAKAVCDLALHLGVLQHLTFDLLERFTAACDLFERLH